MIRFSPREPVNSLTHVAGAIMAGVGLLVLLFIAAGNGSTRQLVAFSIFGGSLVATYCASAFYHTFGLTERRITQLRRIDQMMIYILIAGTYTPICMILLRGGLGLGLLIAVWSIATLGVVLTIAWVQSPPWVSNTLYLGMGWIAVLVVRPLLAAAPAAFVLLLFIGGIIYTIGAVMLALEWPRVKAGSLPRLFGSHEIWHLCVIAGSCAHYWAILAYTSAVR
ncbi:MAG TPA: hemolysin III family protein [Gemmatimonadaceae bacterium]|jgi:hemolysin III